MPTYHVTLNAEPWVIIERSHVLRDDHGDEKHLGYCETSTRTINVEESLSDTELFDTTVHECLHAIFPYLAEDAVDKGSTELTHALIQLGYGRKECLIKKILKSIKVYLKSLIA